MRVGTLGPFGHKGHAVAGLTVRPLLDVRVAQVLRSAWRREQGARSLRRPLLLHVGESPLPFFVVGFFLHSHVRVSRGHALAGPRVAR